MVPDRQKVRTDGQNGQTDKMDGGTPPKLYPSDFVGVNKEHKGVICYMTSLNNFSKALVLQDECFGMNYLSFLDFTRN